MHQTSLPTGGAHQGRQGNQCPGFPDFRVLRKPKSVG